MQESRTFTMRYSNHIVDETTHAFKCAKWFALVSSLLLGIFGTVLLLSLIHIFHALSDTNAARLPCPLPAAGTALLRL